MMKSLWSGVSGLQAHQTAMDVEGNNIANVNTVGFKYSRANFSNMFSQTMKIATIPTDGLGGQNPMQVGLGTSINSTTRIHSQGSVQSTDKNTDVAIDGDGFFIVSDDKGLSRYLTREGGFALDATGNFVNTSGYVVQGWNVDWESQVIDNSRSAENIFIEPGMHIPAQVSTEVGLKANLNSGNNVGDKSRPIYGLDSVHKYNNKKKVIADENDVGTNQFYTTTKNALELHEKGVDMGSVFNAKGQSLNIREGQGIWVSYADAVYQTPDVATYNPNNELAQNNVAFWGSSAQVVRLNITLNGVTIDNENIHSLDEAIAFINQFTVANETRQGTGVRAVRKDNGQGIKFINDNSLGTTDNMKNINLVFNSTNSAGVVQNAPALNQQAAIQTFPATLGAALRAVVITAHKYTYSSNPVNILPLYDPDGGPAWNQANLNPPAANANPNSQEQVWQNYSIQGELVNGAGADIPRTFRTTEDLRELMQRDARFGTNYSGWIPTNAGNAVAGAPVAGAPVAGARGSGLAQVTAAAAANDPYPAVANANLGAKVEVNDQGYFVFTNVQRSLSLSPGAAAAANMQANSKDMSINVTAYSDEAQSISANEAFANIFKGFDGPFVAGNELKSSGQLKLSALATGLEVYDSLGGKHVIDVQFVKQSTTTTGGNLWQMIIRVPEPATINTTGEGPNNIVVGTARFNNDGSLSSYSPRSISFSPNNGAKPNQQILLSFGTSGANDGLISSNMESAMTSQFTNGYPPGTLKPDAVRVDEKGNILGEFDNGKVFAVAKIAMGSVANNGGLEELGGNLYKTTGNSGDIVVGTAGTGGRGSMKTASLEMSNVDLSRSLTQLIIVQRGYQANSKTISTSDQMLNTLLQLKQ